jgi:hypothetical protein
MRQPSTPLQKRMGSLYFEILDENGEVADIIQSDDLQPSKLRAKRPRQAKDDK